MPTTNSIPASKESVSCVSSNIYNKLNEKCVIFEIPIDLVGLIIGKNGVNAEHIKEKTGCRVHIDDKKGLCQILGSSKLGILKARRTIEEIIRENREKKSSMVEKCVIEIPVEYVSIVIGVGGAHVQKIARITKCYTQINSTTGACEIVGPSEGIPRAINEILKLVKYGLKQDIMIKLKSMSVLDETCMNEISDTILNEGLVSIQKFKSIVQPKKLAEIEKYLKDKEAFINYRKSINKPNR